MTQHGSDRRWQAAGVDGIIASHQLRRCVPLVKKLHAHSAGDAPFGRRVERGSIEVWALVGPPPLFTAARDYHLSAGRGLWRAIEPGADDCSFEPRQSG